MQHRIVHNLVEAVAALTEAAGQPLTLHSPPAAARSLGVGGWLALLRLARAAVPAHQSLGLLDCGAAPGLALAALREGAEAVRVEAPPAVLDKLRQIAAQTGARVYGAGEIVPPQAPHQ